MAPPSWPAWVLRISTFALLQLVQGCDTDRSTPPVPAAGDDAAAGAAPVIEDDPPAEVAPRGAFGKSIGGTTPDLQEGPGSGGAKGGSAPLGAPFGTSTSCGDAIVGGDEECDDGNEGSDACTAHCQTRDQPVVASNTGGDRYIGLGRHPVAGLDGGLIATYVEAPNFAAGAGSGGAPDEGVKVGATLLDIWGKKQHQVDVSEGAFPIDEANPVAAALPGGDYAVAWSDFDGDGSDLGIALRRVKNDGTLGPLGVANTQREFSQRNPDMIWTGSQLVVAWEDYANAFSGPDIRYRLFDAELRPLSDDLTLASGDQLEAAVSLAPLHGGWAAAYREESLEDFAGQARETVVVRAGEKKYRIGRYFGGPMEDRPALAELDATHLLVVFTEGTDPGQQAGVLNTPRLRYAVVDTATNAAPTYQSLNALDDMYITAPLISQMSPALERAKDGSNALFLSWRTEGRPGDASGDQIWLKRISWDPSRETPLDLDEPEVLIPRLCEDSIGDQRRPALAAVDLPPSGALAIAWDDYSHSQGPQSGDPEVVVHYSPTRSRAAEPSIVTENWNGTSGSPWPDQWQHILSAYTVPPVTIQDNRGQVAWGSGTGTAYSYIKDHKALDVEMLTKVRMHINSVRTGFVARLIDGPQPSFIGAWIGTQINDRWRFYAQIDGVHTDIFLGPSTGTTAPLAPFTTWAQNLEFYMRFRLASNADGGINLALRHWLTDLPEPSTWTMQATTNTPAIVATFGSTPGRFGLFVSDVQANRIASFDDFRANFYEGNAHGDPSLTASTTPLERQESLFRMCAPGSPCALAQGCCLGDSDCAAGTSCQGGLSEVFGLGSHLDTCLADHCENEVLDTALGEVRTDCGGPDCAPCTCTTTTARGANGYCTTAGGGCFCGIGDGSCTSVTQCLPGLACKPGGLKFGYATNINVCQPFHCMNLVQDMVVNDGRPAETGVDCGGECGACL